MVHSRETRPTGWAAEPCAEARGLGEEAAWLGRIGLQWLPAQQGSLGFNEVSLASLTQSSVATDSWGALSGQSTEALLGERGGGAWPPSRGQGPVGLGSALLMGQGCCGLSRFPSSWREAPAMEGFCLV